MQQELAPEGFLRIAWYTADTTCLGPGHRFALWVQGCQQRCPGCIAVPLQSMTGGTLVPISALLDAWLASGCADLTVSGGEPFLQAAGLTIFLQAVRTKRSDCGVILYTGLQYEVLFADTAAKPLLSYIDLLIDGDYQAARDDGKAMRGSSNQRLLFLTSRYQSADLPSFRKNQVQFTTNGLRMIGIPSEGARQFLNIVRDA